MEKILSVKELTTKKVVKIEIKDEYGTRVVTRTYYKHRCFGGPLDKKKVTREDAMKYNKYSLFNASSSCTSFRDRSKKAVLIYDDLL